MKTSTQLDYLVESIAEAPWSDRPFRHVWIDGFFEPADFERITRAREVELAPATNDEALLDALFAAGYKIIEFPGCITDHVTYAGIGSAAPSAATTTRPARASASRCA